jgi:hypothetical protein
MVAAGSMLDDFGWSESSGALSVLLLLDRRLFTSAIMKKNERFKKEDSDGWRSRYPWLKVKKVRFCKKRSNAPKSGEKTYAGFYPLFFIKITFAYRTHHVLKLPLLGNSLKQTKTFKMVNLGHLLAK